MKVEIKSDHQVRFGSSAHAPMNLPSHTNLSECLTIQNSPVFFGCRTGICGTCLVQVEVLLGEIPPPKSEEAELLQVIAPGNSKARLACQLDLIADINIERILPKT